MKKSKQIRGVTLEALKKQISPEGLSLDLLKHPIYKQQKDSLNDIQIKLRDLRIIRERKLAAGPGHQHHAGSYRQRVVH